MGFGARLLARLTNGAGTGTTRALHLGLGLVGLCAWLSWWAQIEVLIGTNGLLPAATVLERAGSTGLAWWRLPSLLRLTQATDLSLHGLCALGVVGCVLASIGVLPRVSHALNAVLYLSLVNVCGPFAAFQWDNLMVECFVLGALLPRKGASLTHFAFRVLFVRLYFGSGIAKWQSPLGDWIDGSAMAFYYETTPLPTPLSWWMHNLPRAVHALESWATLGLEIVCPWGALGGRRMRHVTAAVFTGFQLLNLLTGNFGFFVYLSVVLHVALLDSELCARVLRRWPALGRRSWSSLASVQRVADALVVLYLVLCSVEQAAAFGAPLAPLSELRLRYLPLRVANTYALFASVTRTRVEPLFEVDAGNGYDTWAMRYKPGPIDQPLGWVAPHQPRVDFRLWFYGLSPHGAPPPYVRSLLYALCERPSAIQGLFRQPLPEFPRAVRVRFEAYRFTDRTARRASGATWVIESSFGGPGLSCGERPRSRAR